MVRLAVDGRELTEGVRTGIGRYLVEVLKAASEAGWECLVYSDREVRLPGTFRGVTTHVISALWTPWWDQVNLPRRLARDRASVFLSPYYKGPLRAPCPTVLTVHDLLFIRYPGAHRPLRDAWRTRLASLYASRATALVTDSEYSRREILDLLGVEPGKVRVIPLAPNPAFRPSRYAQPPLAKYGLSRPYVLYVGNFKPHKNLPRLVEAYARLNPWIRNEVDLVLAGEDQRHRPALEKLGATLGLAGRLKFPGFIDEKDLPAVYRAATLVVVPSLVEGFGLPVLEAMRCGAAVAASNRGALPEVAGNGALLFDPEDGDAMTDALEQGLGDPALRVRLKERGLARGAVFTPERTTGQLLSLLRDLSVAQGAVDSRVSAMPTLDG